VTAWVTQVTLGVSAALLWATTLEMRIQKLIQRRIRRSSEGVDFVGDVNAAISANVGEPSSTSHVSSRSSVSAQAGGRKKETRSGKEAQT
jgi:hypothetical protein